MVRPARVEELKIPTFWTSSNPSEEISQARRNLLDLDIIKSPESSNPPFSPLDFERCRRWRVAWMLLQAIFLQATLLPPRRTPLFMFCHLSLSLSLCRVCERGIPDGSSSTAPVRATDLPVVLGHCKPLHAATSQTHPPTPSSPSISSGAQTAASPPATTP
ncbi:hypothetical protein FH972_005575 [Carpinus fangiana]|uniref:Uncharacterized protein n=1 Tax=Carpinus fangiana TaxID=176857 RepID=A0A5N6QT60_9ROSI|nr:hypothetical protein FH972_005575 [Carpinus fangiana]